MIPNLEKLKKLSQKVKLKQILDIRITITYISFVKGLHEYAWLFYFKKFRYLSGFNIRLFGLNIKIQDGGGTEKLIKNYEKSINSKKNTK